MPKQGQSKTTKKVTNIGLRAPNRRHPRRVFLMKRNPWGVNESITFLWLSLSTREPSTKQTGGCQRTVSRPSSICCEQIGSLRFPRLLPSSDPADKTQSALPHIRWSVLQLWSRSHRAGRRRLPGLRWRRAACWRKSSFTFTKLETGWAVTLLKRSRISITCDRVTK